MNERTLSLALGALLHDIGKFMLRAGVSGKLVWNERENQEEFGYKHALLTDTFVADYVPSQWHAAVRGLAGRHHRPRTDDERIVQQADHLSAGERDDGRSSKDERPRTKHPQQLQSIFCRVHADGVTAPEPLYLPLQPMQLERGALFPGPARSSEATQRDYEALWAEFAAEMTRLRNAHEGNGNLAVYLENVQLLMQRYTWCIPAAYFGSVPDISLYDHSRMTAALAAVLADLEDGHRADGSVPVAQLIGADISGVQDFIYTISSRGATASLRGRSFYVQMLTEVVARFLLQELDLPITNLIYVGGGNVVLLGRAHDAARLEEARHKLSTVLLQHHRGDLYVATAWAPMSRDALTRGTINDTLASLHRNLRLAKQKRFAELGNAMAELFAPTGTMGTEEQLCQVCGMEDAGCTADGTTNVRKCPACVAFEELGDDLRNARYLMIRRIDAATADNVTDGPGTWEEVFKALGYAVRVEKSLHTFGQDLGSSSSVILALDDSGLSDLAPTGMRATGRRLFVNTTPLLTEPEVRDLQTNDRIDDVEYLRTGGIKPFSVLEQDAHGVKRLGVLRMDVDNLGQIFSQGLHERASLSRIAALSFAMSIYFDGWVGKIAATIGEQDGRERLYAIYSGGDDLFFVGAWDAVVDLAERIQTDLTSYAANHPGIHASAGIVLTGGKYPLAQAARDAGEAEHRAKAAGKNSISFLGQAVSWRASDAQPGFDSVKARAQEIQTWIEVQGLPKSFISILRAVDTEWRSWRSRESGTGRRYHHRDQHLFLGPWQWHLTYSLYRAAERKHNDALSQQIRDFVTAIVKGEIVTLGMTSRWAELSLRERAQEPEVYDQSRKE